MCILPSEDITAATINAAYTLYLGHCLGSLEVGKQADAVVFDVTDYRQIPYFFGINHAQVTIKAGHIVFDRRQARARKRELHKPCALCIIRLLYPPQEHL